MKDTIMKFVKVIALIIAMVVGIDVIEGIIASVGLVVSQTGIAGIVVAVFMIGAVLFVLYKCAKGFINIVSK